MAAPLTPDDPRRLGAYRLVGRLGEGGQGVVYLAHGPGGERVAVKLLLRGDPETRARLTRELSALASVAPFCTARVLAASVDGPRPYVVSEFVDGPSLQERIREHGPLRGGELERLVVGTATALAAIHAAGIVHRDFKPANVLLGPDGPRVVDFGIARADGAATMTSGIIGTPAYLAPEQIGGAPASAASDVFAWAATMLCAAGGRAPFGADTLPAVLHRILTDQPDLSELPPRLAGLIGACLDKDPARRPTARALMVGLVDPGGREPGPAVSPTGATPPAGAPRLPPQDTDPAGAGPARPGRRPARRARGLVAGTLLIAVSLVIAGVTVARLLPDDRGGAVSPTRAAGAGEGTGEATGGTNSADDPGAASSHDPGDTGDTGDTTDTAEPVPAGRKSPGTATSPPPGDGRRIPASFAGSWSGHITPSIAFGLREHDVTVGLVAGAGTGTWAEPTSGCTGTLALTQVTGTVLGFDLKPDGAGDCVPGTLTLTRKGAVLAYHWVDGLGLGTSYDGDLSKR
ncbi:protein kinase [Streptosporangium violaceochromogenes]|nr:protein kinase [Streptosporangium violaceochromogenes]